MASITNINNGTKEPTHGYQNCNTNQISIFDEYVKVRESLYARVITWVNLILNHIDARYEGSCVYINLNGVENKNTFKYSNPAFKEMITIIILLLALIEILIIEIQMV